MVNRKCKRCGVIRDSYSMWYSKGREGFICEPTNGNHRQECSNKLNTDMNSSTSKVRDKKVKNITKIRDSKVENGNIQGKNLGIERSRK